MALGQPVDLTGSALPQEIRNFTGIGSGASSWDYLSQKISYGYYVEVYAHFDALARAKVDKRNGIEDLVASSYSTYAKAHLAIADVKFAQDYALHVMETEFAQRSNRSTQIANTYTLNTYLPHSDGSVEYFKDGLLARVDNQRSIDEFGNVALKNLYNFVYDENRRLMLSHEYDTTNSLGLKTHGTFSCTYTADSVFYGTDDTNANKHYSSYTVRETDSTGRTSTVNWTAGTYEGKYLRDFTQKVQDSVVGTSSIHRFNIQYSTPGYMSSYEEDGIVNHIDGKKGTDVDYTYKLSRYNITYSGDQISGYEETRYQMPPTDVWTDDMSRWIKITSKVTMEYSPLPKQFGDDVEIENQRLMKSTVESRVENPDGSFSNEKTVTEYNYDAGYRVTGGTIHTDITGRNADYVEYTDAQGHILSRQTLTDGKVEYSYNDADGKKVVVATYKVDDSDPADVKETLVSGTAINRQDKPGSDYRGSSDSVLEVIGGTPMVKESRSRTEIMGADNSTVTAIEETKVTYTNAVVGYFCRVLSTQETSTSSFPVTDSENEHQTRKEIKTDYYYDAYGYLTGAIGEGFEDSWSYSNDSGWKSHIFAQTTVTYKVELDQARVDKMFVQWVTVPDSESLKSMGVTENEFKTYMKSYFRSNPFEPADGDTAHEITNPFINKGEYVKPADFDGVIAKAGVADDSDTVPQDKTETDKFAAYPDSASLVAQAWKLLDAKNYAEAEEFAQEAIERYSNEAKEQQGSLTSFAPEGKESQYWALNDVATAYFILGKAYAAQNKTAKAKEQFNKIISDYGYAQCWDPRGWYWKVAAGAQDELKNYNNGVS